MQSKTFEPGIFGCMFGQINVAAHRYGVLLVFSKNLMSSVQVKVHGPNCRTEDLALAIARL